MKEVEIRTPGPAEFDVFQRFLERAYGHSYGFFLRHYPHLNRREQEALSGSVIALENGEITSHVGAFPLDVVVCGSHIQTGGIGGVATLPQARGRGLMSRLMQEAHGLMRRRGDVLTVLWGDRQRYHSFGYETCGLKWSITLTQRSLGRADVGPRVVQEVDPSEAHVVRQVRAFHADLAYRVERPHLDLLLQKEGVRVFLGTDGYVVVRGEGRELRIQEVASVAGSEAELILGVMNKTFANSATLDVVPEECTRSASLLDAAARWSVAPQGMFRILDWPKLAQALQPLLQENACHLAPFEVAVGCHDGDDTSVATLLWNGERFEIAPGRHSESYIEYEQRILVARLLGGPFSPPDTLGVVERLLPVPLHIPQLDHV